jgi:hypothetical protein
MPRRSSAILQNAYPNFDCWPAFLSIISKRDVIFHDLPPEVLVQLGPVPSRHRFVRVASDILMIAVGTGMVVDAIEDIGSAMGR